MADGLATYKKMRNRFQNVCFLSLENTEGSQSHIPTSPKDQTRKRKTILPWLLDILWFDLPWSFLNFPDERCEKMREKQRLMAIGDQQIKRDMRTAKRGITRSWLYCWTQQWFYSKKCDMFLVSAEPYWFPGAPQWKLQGGSVKHQKLVVLCSMIGRGYPLRIIKIQGSCCCREQDKKDSSCFLIMMSIAYIGLGSLMDPWHRSTNWHAYGQYVGMI
jgi:hypothetical protein